MVAGDVACKRDSVATMADYAHFRCEFKGNREIHSERLAGVRLVRAAHACSAIRACMAEPNGCEAGTPDPDLL